MSSSTSPFLLLGNVTRGTERGSLAIVVSIFGWKLDPEAVMQCVDIEPVKKKSFTGGQAATQYPITNVGDQLSASCGRCKPMTATIGYSARQIKKLRGILLQRHWWLLALMALLVLALFAAATPFGILLRPWIDPRDFTMLLLGAGTATAIATVIALMGRDGARGHRDGLEAEGWTSDVLKSLQKDGWTLIEDVEFKSENIDHVLLGPGGAIALETKYSSDGWGLTPPRQRSRYRTKGWPQQPLRQAIRQARKLRLLLHAGGVKTDVQPVLVLWGRNLGGPPTVTADGVLVGLGNEATTWLNQIRSTPLTATELRLAQEAVKSLKAGKMVEKPRTPFPTDSTALAPPRPT